MDPDSSNTSITSMAWMFSAMAWASTGTVRKPIRLIKFILTSIRPCTRILSAELSRSPRSSFSYDSVSMVIVPREPVAGAGEESDAASEGPRTINSVSAGS